MGYSIRFAFDDGSEAVAHYGVKGMKWGNWNAETKARYLAEGNASAGGGGSAEEEDKDQMDRGEARTLYQAWSDSIVKDAIPYAEDVTTTGRKWGNDANKAADSVATAVRSGSDYVRTLFGGLKHPNSYVEDVTTTGRKWGNDANKAADSVATAVRSGSDYVRTLLGMKRK